MKYYFQLHIVSCRRSNYFFLDFFFKELNLILTYTLKKKLKLSVFTLSLGMSIGDSAHPRIGSKYWFESAHCTYWNTNLAS